MNSMIKKAMLSAKILKRLIVLAKQAAARDGCRFLAVWIARAVVMKLRRDHPDLAIHAIFLDDERAPPDDPGWITARTFESFKDLAENLDPVVIAFDHDLGANAQGSPLPDGVQCMRALIELALEQPVALASLRLVILHSANPVGRANLRILLESAQRSGILNYVRIEERPVTSLPIAKWPPL